VHVTRCRCEGFVKHWSACVPLLYPGIRQGVLLLLTLGWVIEALQLDAALCCCCLGPACCCCGLVCWQCNDGHLIQGGLEGIEQPAGGQGEGWCLWVGGFSRVAQYACSRTLCCVWWAADGQYACSTPQQTHFHLHLLEGQEAQEVRRKGQHDSLVEL
jgi:hypothetical protein